MTILELKILIEDDGLNFCIENKILNIDTIEDVVLADKISEYMELHKEIMTYIDDKVEEIRDRHKELDNGNGNEELCDIMCG